MNRSKPSPPPRRSSTSVGAAVGHVRSNSGNIGPPWIPFSFSVLTFLTTLIFFFIGGKWFNGFGFLVGSFLGPATLAWFSIEYNKRLSSRRLIERLNSRVVVRSMTLVAWFLGSVNIYYWAEACTQGGCW
ncbi:MAG: hypothetical protein P8K64_00180 [Acidimicrobiales bacterium]|nr:hypothetical protein [Acidimicrobiales bacterium]